MTNEETAVKVLGHYQGICDESAHLYPNVQAVKGSPWHALSLLLGMARDQTASMILDPSGHGMDGSEYERLRTLIRAAMGEWDGFCPV